MNQRKKLQKTLLGKYEKGNNISILLYLEYK